MEFQYMLLIIMGVGFIVFGLGVIFLPEVKEKGEFKDNPEEEKKEKEETSFLWLSTLHGYH